MLVAFLGSVNQGLWSHLSRSWRNATILTVKVSFRVRSVFPVLGSTSASLSSPLYYLGLLLWTESANQAYSVISCFF